MVFLAVFLIIGTETYIKSRQVLICTMHTYDFKACEESMLAFWEKNDLYAKAKQKNKGKKRFYYLDGPPYTSGKVHLGTAWGKALRDCFLRFKRMSGTDVWDRAGFDMHGLPTENGVAKKLKLKHKEDIEKYGLEKFQKACKRFCLDNMQSMIQDFSRLGVWMDFDNAYMSITPEFMEAEWWLIKQAHEKDRLYEGKKCMHWCAHCSTALAKHELEYHNVTDNSIFLKFPIKDQKNEYLIIWTTTPWTIPFNLAVMVNPEMAYVKVQVDKESWIIARPLVGVLMQSVVGKKYTVEDEFLGKELEGCKYLHPFAKDLPYYSEIEKINPRIHTVLLSEAYVDASAGSGLVHCAPGCGPEDFEVGRMVDLPAYNELDENGVFKDTMGRFKGLRAREDDPTFIKLLKKAGALIATTEVEHDYAHCWRCHNGVVFRTTDQWFFKVEDLKERMQELNKEVHWVPRTAFNAFDSWLKNLRDNSITRQRYWGTPVPIWKCKACGAYDVIGSRKELKEKAGKIPEDLHLPWIDRVTYPCVCGKTKERIPDILDVWIDAGTTSWTCLGYPQKKEVFKDLFPADFILEGKDQIRGWFNLLLVSSMLAFEKHPYRAVYMHGFINDAQGRKMSKSQQNYILPSEVVETYGADTLRYYTIGAANPGFDLNYNMEDVRLKHKNLLILWNLHNFVLDLSKTVGMNPDMIKKRAYHPDLPEIYIRSRLHSTIDAMTKAFQEYRLNETPWLFENLYMDLSRTYIQMVREKAAQGTEKEKQTVLKTVFDLLMDLLVLAAPIVPFFAEQVYQNLKQAFDLEERSIHLYPWPKAKEEHQDKELEHNMNLIQKLVSNILALREKNRLGLRWPVQEVIIDTKNKALIAAINQLEHLLAQQVNAKGIRVKHLTTDLEVKPNYKAIGMRFGKQTTEVVDALAAHHAEVVKALQEDQTEFSLGAFTVTKEMLEVSRKLPEGLAAVEISEGTIYLDTHLTAELEAEGYAREVMRRVQQLRKKAGLHKKDKIRLLLIPDVHQADDLEEWKDTIAEKTGCAAITISNKKEGSYTHALKETIKGQPVTLWIKKA